MKGFGTRHRLENGWEGEWSIICAIVVVFLFSWHCCLLIPILFGSSGQRDIHDSPVDIYFSTVMIQLEVVSFFK